MLKKHGVKVHFIKNESTFCFLHSRLVSINLIYVNCIKFINRYTLHVSGVVGVTVFLAVINFEKFQQQKLTRVSVTGVPVLIDL